MRFVLGMAIVLLCSGCATRTITLVYYPQLQDPAKLPALAQRDCARYNLEAQEAGQGIADFGRLTQTYNCVPR